jgi:hypothetical protein
MAIYVQLAHHLGLAIDPGMRVRDVAISHRQVFEKL